MVKDHLGNEFKTKQDMCDHYGINRTTFNSRMSKGHTLEESLCSIQSFVQDHEGNRFKNISDMCKYWNIKQKTYIRRRDSGKSLKECLEGRLIYDHKGNEFISVAEMLRYWDVDNATYSYRKRVGYTLKECLEGKDKAVTDHFGQAFDSERQMCIHYGVPQETFKHRFHSMGLSLEESLTKQNNRICDFEGNEFSTVEDMCKHWGIKRNTYEERRRKKFSMEECLSAIPLIGVSSKDITVDKHLRIIRNLDGIGKYFECELDNKEIILHHDDIIDYYRENILRNQHRRINNE